MQWATLGALLESNDSGVATDLFEFSRIMGRRPCHVLGDMTRLHNNGYVRRVKDGGALLVTSKGRAMVARLKAEGHLPDRSAIPLGM